MIPTEVFYTKREESWDHRVSPDGTKLLWLAMKDGQPTIHFRSLGTAEEAQTITAERRIGWAYWTNDSRHVMIWSDHTGDENYQVFVADTENLDQVPRSVTPHAGSKVRHQQKFPDRPNEYLLQQNRRDRSVFDLYRLNVLSGKEVLVARNPGDVFKYYTDQAGKVVAVKRRLPNRLWSLDVPDGDGWRSITTGGTEDKLWIEGHPLAGAGWAWAVSNIGRDRQVVVRLDLNTGDETLFYEDALADVQGLWIDEITYEPLIASSMPGYLKTKIFNPQIKAVFEQIGADGRFDFSFKSWNRDKSLLTVAITRDTQGTSNFLIDARTGKVMSLAAPQIAQYRQDLSTMVPVRFPARDGLELNGYLTLPAGTQGKQLPTILRVHGGPFARDYWGYQADDQFLANRGYAVLRVNYRGSTGFGRQFMKAAQKQFARKMHDDLIDAVNWMVEKGISDPEKVAIYGHSYGGYATLVGLTFTPDIFAAGISVVGVADLVSAFESFPSYWKNSLARWHAYVGHPENPEDRTDMASRSPINYVDRINKPMLVVHGANDVRVSRSHSDRIVAAVTKNGRAAKYIVFDDEGHNIRKQRNKMTFARALEQFLAQHLGGRAELAARPPVAKEAEATAKP
ncbi:MAG: S9 family peptidase [Alphaproteobacteria bacterium]|nr:S9 family peptidase [Alphaproteobacteria bacterium]